MVAGLLKGIAWGGAFRSESAVEACAIVRKPDTRGRYVDRVQKTFAIVYVLDGSGEFTDWNNVTHAVGAGCLIQLPAGRRHSVVHQADGNWVEAWMTFKGSFGKMLIDLGTIIESQPVLRPGVDRTLVEQFDRIRGQLRDTPARDLPATLAAAHQLIVSLYAADRRRESVDPQTAMIERAAALLGRDLGERLDVADIASGMELSYERFRKIFRDRIGLSPGEYRIRRRIDEARAMLSQHRMSTKEIAYALGYADPFTFSKQFKRFVGMSPTAFRKRA